MLRLIGLLILIVLIVRTDLDPRTIWTEVTERVKFYLPGPSNMSLIEEANHCGMPQEMADCIRWSAVEDPFGTNSYWGSFGGDDVVENFCGNVQQRLSQTVGCGVYENLRWHLVLLCVLLPVAQLLWVKLGVFHRAHTMRHYDSTHRTVIQCAIRRRR